MMPDRVTRLAYGLGATAFGAKLHLFGLLLLFYNQVVGLPAASVSFVLATSIVLDALWDPLVGQISDNTRSRWGRRHPYLYAVAVPLALAFALLWQPPAGWSQPALLAWLAVFAILVRLLTGLHEIPSTALLPELARGYDERTTLLGYRYFFGAVGATISAVLGFGIFLRSTPEQPFGQLNRAGYAPFGATIAAVMLVTILTSALGTHRHIPKLRSPAARPAGSAGMLRVIVKTLSNRNFAVIAVSGLVHGINLGIHGGLAVYFSTYFWALPSEKLLWLSLASLPANFAAAFLAPVFAKSWGKKRACVALFLAAIALGNLPLAAGLLGWMPPAGTAAQFLDPARRPPGRRRTRYCGLHYRHVDDRRYRRRGRTAHGPALGRPPDRRRHIRAEAEGWSGNPYPRRVARACRLPAARQSRDARSAGDAPPRLHQPAHLGRPRRHLDLRAVALPDRPAGARSQPGEARRLNVERQKPDAHTSIRRCALRCRRAVEFGGFRDSVEFQRSAKTPCA